jgi:hypothetical protein
LNKKCRSKYEINTFGIAARLGEVSVISLSNKVSGLETAFFRGRPALRFGFGGEDMTGEVCSCKGEGKGKQLDIEL